MPQPFPDPSFIKEEHSQQHKQRRILRLSEKKKNWAKAQKFEFTKKVLLYLVNLASNLKLFIVLNKVSEKHIGYFSIEFL